MAGAIANFARCGGGVISDVTYDEKQCLLQALEINSNDANGYRKRSRSSFNELPPKEEEEETKSVRIYVCNLAGDFWVNGEEFQFTKSDEFSRFEDHFVRQTCQEKDLDQYGLVEYKFLLELEEPKTADLDFLASEAVGLSLEEKSTSVNVDKGMETKDSEEKEPNDTSHLYNTDKDGNIISIKSTCGVWELLEHNSKLQEMELQALQNESDNSNDDAQLATNLEKGTLWLQVMAVPSKDAKIFEVPLLDWVPPAMPFLAPAVETGDKPSVLRIERKYSRVCGYLDAIRYGWEYHHPMTASMVFQFILILLISL